MKILKFILHSIVFVLLTMLTQIGGIIYLLAFGTHKIIDQKTANQYGRTGLKFLSFLLLYVLATFIIVPPLAKSLGRVRLPLGETHHLRPLTFLTCFLNRNYVKPEMKAIAFEVADAMHAKFPGTNVNYLDGNFPFIDKFPLFPHLSHNDGKKLDLSFCYTDKTEKQTNLCPSFIGYGICEMPREGEENTADFCSKNGYWQYSLLKVIVPQSNANAFSLDENRTRTLVNLIAEKPPIGKIFIEPHLKKRLGLTTPKIRFHGCQAVRHDDHLHIQLK